ncbi:secretion-regulating guanine nucleotide exchange factor isoform X3 [Sciurus carolinensis]|uniref:secretion-regulating guanine nucleotide exchange factor isoform X3 n=1 Tax=Sciurus carolinensis TaxID=30640 RepID=UPI001FB428A8|nr:secretion-regulating guanine nucleotide exchange factor isoform X3 [Sciurus carolinensis]
MEREPRADSEAAPAAPALFAWGANSYGQLGLGHKEDVLLPQQLNDFCKPECVRMITGGGGHSAIVTDGGGLFVCGLNKDGQLGLGHTEDVLYFTLCKSLLGCPVQQVACGWDFTIILTENGQVLSCGSNSFGQLGVPHGPRRCVVPQAIELLREKVACVAAGLRHALAATVSGIVFQWGTGLASSGRRSCPGQTLPLFLTAREPSRVTGLENCKAICVLAGSDHSASLTDAGELYVWGSNKHGQLATQAAFLPMPQKIEAHCFQNEKVTAIWSGWTHLIAQTETSKLFTWGRADYGQLGRKLESHDGWKGEKQDSVFPSSRPQNSPPSSLHCLTGATEVECVTPGAGTSMACVVMAPKSTSGPRSRCSFYSQHQDSLWDVALATPWPSVSCQHTLHWAKLPGSPTLPWMPQRTPNFRKPWTEGEIRRKDNQKLQPKAILTVLEMEVYDRQPLIKWPFPPKVFLKTCFVGLWD